MKFYKGDAVLISNTIGKANGVIIDYLEDDELYIVEYIIEAKNSRGVTLVQYRLCELFSAEDLSSRV